MEDYKIFNLVQEGGGNGVTMVSSTPKEMPAVPLVFLSHPAPSFWNPADWRGVEGG